MDTQDTKGDDAVALLKQAKVTVQTTRHDLKRSEALVFVNVHFVAYKSAKLPHYRHRTRFSTKMDFSRLQA